jgi:hypothetical protein
MTGDEYSVEHFVVVLYDQADEHGPDRFQAACACGWTAQDRHTDPLRAEVDGDDHLEVALDPPDGLDAVISGLLDLQDDLAQVVMWLAEHWTARLPVPISRGEITDPAGIVLSVYCLEPGDLVEVAALLGVPVVDDVAPDVSGNRYRRAVRRFGRVRVEAFRRIDPTCTACDTETTAAVCPTCHERVDAPRARLEVA